MKKLLSLALALTLVLSLSVTAFASGMTMYVDISQIVDSSKPVQSVVGTVYDGDVEEDVAVTHVSGTIYSYIETHAIEDYVYGTPSFIIEVLYGDEDGVSASVIYNENETGSYNLYTFGSDGQVGTWSTYTPTSNGSGPSVTNGNHTVTGKYQAGAESGTIYSVDISWGSMAFTYTAAGKGNWNTTDHVYKDATAAAWSWADGDNEIKVINHSNDGITVTPSYTKDSGYENASMTFGNAPLTLTTADNGENGAAGEATKGTITVTPSGSVPEGTSGKIGQITLSIAGTNSSAGSDTTDEKAVITGVEIRVGDAFYKSGDTVTLTPDSGDGVVILVKGTNLQNRTDDNKIKYEIGSAWPMGNGYAWTVNEVGTEAFMFLKLSKFDDINELFEIQYSNDGGKTYTGTGVWIIYKAE